ncbi:MAG: neutral/alkaline non-lysosomal ceramidase N-terminal domain-containing protein [Caldicoprobacterales bacterium]|jgi:neutral ceramidase|nr:hypothetical protein [Clostridiales bacterium]
MKYSFAKELITPDWPTRMSGFASRTSKSVGVYDDLYTRTLMIDDGEKRILIITLDICMIERGFVNEVKGIIEERFGINGKDIMIHTVHTHAGPVSSLAYRESCHEVYDDTIKFREFLRERIIRCVERCLDSSREGYLEIGFGETYIGMDRRQKTPEGVRIGPNPEGEIDRKIFVMAIKDEEDRPRVILFTCPCHPVVLYHDNLYISADFPGAAISQINKKFPGAEAMFLQGAGADINPAVLVADDEYRDTFYSDVIFTGNILANDVYNIMRCGMKKVIPELETCLERVPVFLDEDATLEKDRVEATQECEVKVSVLKLSQEVRIIGLDGEVCNQVGVHISSLFDDGYTIVVGYANGYIGYIPTPQILAEGGYEPNTNIFGGKFASDVEDILLERIRNIKEQISQK